MRRIQLALALILLVESAAVTLQGARLAERFSPTADGTILPSPFLFPSPFSAGLALIAASVLAGFLFLAAPATRLTFAGSLAHFTLASAGIWSFHRAILWIQSFGGHGLPGWW
jgi:hypothetical protein